MKLEIKQSILMEHLNYVIKGISSKNIIPVLNCIKFELTNEGLYLMSTDNDIAIKTFITKEKIEKIEMLGTILVSGRYIYEIIRKLPGEVIKIEEVLDNKIDIKTANSNFNLNCNEASEFPILDLQDNGNTLEASATDSYRVSKKKVELKEESKIPVNIIIPTRNLNELIKLLEEDDENIELHIFSNKIIFKFNSIIMMSRLINGDFPDLSKLIPDTYYLEVTVNLNTFYKALDRASLLTNESDKNIVTFRTDEDIAQISSNIPEIGHVEETVDIEKNNENEIEISFSSKYMMDAVRTLECENIKIMFNGELKPIIIKNLDDDNLIELIVPIRTY